MILNRNKQNSSFLEVRSKTMMTIVIALFVIGWVAASIIGTQAYFRGEMTKPIHNRNLRSSGFAQWAKYVTGAEVDFSNRVITYPLDAYTRNTLPE